MYFDPVAVLRAPLYGNGGTFTYTGTAGVSAAFGGGSSVWVYCTSDAYISVGVGTTATATCCPIPAYTPVVVPAVGGARLSAIQVSGAGSCYFCPLE